MGAKRDFIGLVQNGKVDYQQQSFPLWQGKRVLDTGVRQFQRLRLAQSHHVPIRSAGQAEKSIFHRHLVDLESGTLVRAWRDIDQAFMLPEWEFGVGGGHI